MLARQDRLCTEWGGHGVSVCKADMAETGSATLTACFEDQRSLLALLHRLQGYGEGRNCYTFLQHKLSTRFWGLFQHLGLIFIVEFVPHCNKRTLLYGVASMASNVTGNNI